LSAQRAITVASSENFPSQSNDRNNNSQQLSASAPDTFCMSFMSENNQDTMRTTSTLKLQHRRQQFKKPGPLSTDDTTDKKMSKSQQNVGKVKNLKMNFEAKANNTNQKSNSGSVRNKVQHENISA